MKNCHICDGVLKEISQNFSLLNQVTSDCHSWGERGGELAVCQSCGVVQKRITSDWLQQIDSIYANYDIYNQGCGSEQSSFIDGIGVSRSKRIITWVDQIKAVSSQGSILDFGCGNGSFLREFRKYRPYWKLTGFELGDCNKNVIEDIPGVNFYYNSLDALSESYDLIVAIHTLEHLQNPVKFLELLKLKLNPEGLILIEVPDLEKSIFDILIVDHCSHFIKESLIYVSKLAGLEVVKITSNFISNEISLLLKPKDSSIAIINFAPIEKKLLDQEEKIIASHISWLIDLRNQALNVSSFVGIFGTSIGGTWLASELNNKVSFFVDEDKNRIGNIHMGIPIISISDVVDGICVLVPLRKDIAVAIVKRLTKNNNIRFILP